MLKPAKTRQVVRMGLPTRRNGQRGIGLTKPLGRQDPAWSFETEAVPSTERLERRLTAILAADVVGYSGLTSADEEGTHIRLKEHLHMLVYPKIGEHSAGSEMIVECNFVHAIDRTEWNSTAKPLL